jgi:hypothetical protein
MFKIVILDSQDVVLSQEFYLTSPSEVVLNRAFLEAVKRFKMIVKIKVETVKYIDIGQVA